ncbi:hypothetical protein FO519_000925 [Halicephalobus sp. NKZ332]|nr:hypothetical protein FO519_000925 [Halicephalobus sp. NKZ332]
MSGRLIYLIRHGERIDNVSHNWQKKSEYKSFKYDNSPLSDRGKVQGKELAKWFADKEVSHIFVSPFDRTLETASYMIGDREIPMKLEASFIEVLYLCEDPPGVRPKEDLIKKFPLIDTNYKSLIDPWNPKFKNEDLGDDGCFDRCRTAIKRVLNENEGNIAIVSHAATIRGILKALVGRATYVGQATVSVISEEDNTYIPVTISSADHLSDKSNLRPY